MIPDRWREGRVVLIPKPSSASSDVRPLTVLSCAWRLGAKALAVALRSWAEGWAGCRTLGGVHRRSVKDAFLRILASFDDDFLYVQQDLSKFFDGVRLPHLLLTLERFGAPQALRSLVESFYGDHWRVFCNAGVVGRFWHRIRCGLAQGCPLSPVLAACVMAAWSLSEESGHEGRIHTVSFVDDRLLWCRDLEAARLAKQRSDAFDAAYMFTCDVAKCKVAHKPGRLEGATLAVEFGYAGGPSMDILGIHVALATGHTPTLCKFDLQVARRRLRFIGLASQSLSAKQRLVRALVLPMVTWAGGFARFAEAEFNALCSEVRYLVGRRLACDAPAVLLYEVAGWECHPKFAVQRAALAEAGRLRVHGPAWIEEESVRFAAFRWYHLLPVAVEILQELGWWTDVDGRYLCRRDAGGALRRFELGVDGDAVLEEWLRDWHRRRGVNNCGRVANSLHRPPAENLAQGLHLPGVPRDSLCIFAGHVEAWRGARDAVDRSTALAAGCSTWHKCRRNPNRGREPPDCLCGGRLPSRPHLAWCCPSTASLRVGVRVPVHRLEERLFACIRCRL